MSRDVEYVGPVVVDPHGLASGYGDAGARGVLDRNSVSAAVMDDVGLLDGGNDKVPRPARRPRQVQTQVPGGLGSVYIREGEGDVATGEGDTRGPYDGFFERCAQVDVGGVTPDGDVLAGRHQLDFQARIGTSHSMDPVPRELCLARLYHHFLVFAAERHASASFCCFAPHLPYCAMIPPSH